MRPRSRTLVTVHKEILNDVVSSFNSNSCLWNGVMGDFWSATTNILGERVELFNLGQLTLFLLIIIARALITFLQVFPSNITDRSMRVQVDGKRQQIVQLDPLDIDLMEDKLDAIIDCYHKLTTHKISLGFSKPSVFQQKIIKSRKEKAAGKQ